MVGLEINIIEDFRERKVDSIWIEDFDKFAKEQWSNFDYKLSDGENAIKDRGVYFEIK